MAFKKLCESKEKCKRQEEEEEIKRAKTEGQIWKYINKERKKEEWRDHFKELLGGSNERVTGRKREHLTVGEDESELTEKEIGKQIKRLKKKKATGGDKIPNEAWVYSAGNTRGTLIDLIRRVWKGESLSEDWRKAIITAVSKKGDTEDTSNYKGISLLNTAYKLYAAILSERLKKEVEDKGIIPETQAGFRKHRGMMDNAFILRHVVERERWSR